MVAASWVLPTTGPRDMWVCTGPVGVRGSCSALGSCPWRPRQQQGGEQLRIKTLWPACPKRTRLVIEECGRCTARASILKSEVEKKTPDFFFNWLDFLKNIAWAKHSRSEARWHSRSLAGTHCWGLGGKYKHVVGAGGHFLSTPSGYCLHTWAHLSRLKGSGRRQREEGRPC